MSQSSAASTGVYFDEDRWLSHVQRVLERDAAGEAPAAPKVFDVPSVLRETKPEAYQPQHFALGPYHCGRPELRDMERYKLAAAKRAEALFAGGRKFDHLAQRLLPAQDKMRAPYHRSLELSEQTLAWMMAIDTCFLLDFLESYHHRGEATDTMSSAANWINATVRDVMMLENQVPLFVFSQVVSLRHPADEQQAAADALHAVLDRFIKDVSPIKTTAELPVLTDVAKHAHMLELLYHFLIPDASVFAGNGGDQEQPLNPAVPADDECSIDVVDPSQPLPPDYDKVKRACVQVSSLDVAPVRFIRDNLIPRVMSTASSVTGQIMSKVPLLSAVVPLVTKLMVSTTDAESRLKGVNMGGVDDDSSPLAQEIKIPSVATLVWWGVRIVPAPDGIAGISFDAATATLSLPVLTLDGNTEVVLRNLVAYEAVAVRGPLVLARYTELMNGIIDTDEDVKILSESGVVVNHLKSDKEAAEMWNGMCRATRLSKVPPLDATIREVNAHRSRRLAARVQTLLKKYVFKSWRILTLLATVVMLIMTAMQTFCSVYPCNSRWFGSAFQLPVPQSAGGEGR